MSEDRDGKDREPTQKKLDDARARGDVARSADLTAAAGVAGLSLAGLVWGQAALLGFGGAAKGFIGQAGQGKHWPGGAESWSVWRPVAEMVLPLLPLFVVPGVAAAAALAAQRALVFSGEKLAPQLSRIDPMANAAHKFGRAGLLEFVKSAAKLLLVAALLAWFLGARAPRLIYAADLPALPASAVPMRLLVEFMIMVAAISMTVGGLDYLWQVHEHRRRNRMSHQDLVEEFRESEGDPHVKGQRRQRAQEIAMNRMLADVPKADVVVVNPTHFAVALKWNRKSRRAPVCLAKGVDEVAARIRETAAVAGVPIHSDPATARALYATIEIGREIRPEHFAPVAVAIRYAERMRKRARERGGMR